MPRSTTMGEITFNYLPDSPLSHHWRLALKEKPGLTASVSPDRPDGMFIVAEDAIDYDVEKYQQVCNRVRFAARLSHRSYVYARVHLVSKDGKAVSRDGWIACDTGDKAPREESRHEWVIHRLPGKDGWAEFDLSLSEEVSRTFGKAEGLQFSELLGFRLRGSLAISPITLYRDEQASTSPEIADETDSAEKTGKTPWSRGDKLALWTIVVMILIAAVSLAFPDVRALVGLGRQQPVRAPISNGQIAKDVEGLRPSDIQTLRQQNHVSRIAESDSDKTFAEIPTNSFGFARATDFWLKPLGRTEVSSQQTNGDFEIEKLADGTALIVGYVSSNSLDNLDEGLSKGQTLTLYSGSLKEATNLISIPITKLSVVRVREVPLDESERTGSRVLVVALDCKVN